MKRSLKWFITLFVGVAVFYLMPWKSYLERLDWFNIRTITIDVEAPLTRNQVANWVARYHHRSLLTLRIKDIVDKIQQRKWVREVTVHKRFPDHLELSIKTKRPAALLMRKRRLYLTDIDGQTIDRLRPHKNLPLDLAVISLEKQSGKIQWTVPDAVRLMKRIQEVSKNDFTISQLVMESYPYFRLYLSYPKMEVTLSNKNWESQLQRLVFLLRHYPFKNPQISRINLVFSKKAIVSSNLSN